MQLITLKVLVSLLCSATAFGLVSWLMQATGFTLVATVTGWTCVGLTILTIITGLVHLLTIVWCEK